MTPKQQIKHDIQPYTRKVWIALVIVVTLELAFAAFTRTIHIQCKESQRVKSSR